MCTGGPSQPTLPSLNACFAVQSLVSCAINCTGDHSTATLPNEPIGSAWVQVRDGCGLGPTVMTF